MIKMLQKIITTAKSYLEDITLPTDTVIDATCGNGHDTAFLSQLVKQGHVYSFDIQKEALENAQEKYTLDNVTYIHDGHEHVSQYVTSPVKGAIFNLGYLPGGDKAITTNFPTTKLALEEIFKLLAPHGRIAIVIYHGHPSGQTERDALLSELAMWPQDSATVLQYQYINQKNNAPFLILIEKNSD